MTDHPITPPPELVKQWLQEGYGALAKFAVTPSKSALYLTTAAARWGADQELEACCEWMAGRYGEESHAMGLLRAARRPKPPSLKEQALALIDGCNDPHGDHLDDAALDTIRRALEQLDD